MKRMAVLSLALLLGLTACTNGVTDDSPTKEQSPTSSQPTEATVTPVNTEPPTEPSSPTEPSLVMESTEPQYNIVIIEEEVVALAKMAWGEARGCSDMEIAATMWCVLNRVDTWGGTVVGRITEPQQFHGYSPNHPVNERIYNLAVDVLTRWQMEKQGASPEEVGRVLPLKYLYFHGDGLRNYFKDAYPVGEIWDWDCVNPYETEDGLQIGNSS